MSSSITSTAWRLKMNDIGKALEQTSTGMVGSTLLAVVLRRRKQWQTTSLYLLSTLMDKGSRICDMMLNGETPRPNSTSHITGDEQRNSTSTSIRYDATRLKPKGRLFAEKDRHERGNRSFQQTKRIGTWNVRSMNQGKLDIVKMEMARTNTNILGISELKWTGMGHFKSDDYKVFYSGNDTRRKNGVAIIVSKDISDSILGYRPVNDRIMSVRIRGNPLNITVIQIYAPTSDAEEEVVNDFYETLQQVLDDTPKGDFLITLGDFNAKVGETPVPGTVGNFGLGNQNDAGLRLIDFCTDNNMFTANTHFQQPKRRLYTWVSPSGEYRNQIDYILCHNRWRNSITSCKTLPGADCGTDHQLLIADIRIKLKKCKKNSVPMRFDLENIPNEYNVAVHNRFQALDQLDREPDELWNEIKTAIREEADKYLTRAKRQKKSPWLSADALEIARARKTAKSKGDLANARELHAKFQRQARKDKDCFLNNECKQIEENNKRGKTRDLFKKIKDITGTFQPRLNTIRNKQGRDLMLDNDIKERWKEYTETLYKEENKTNDTHENHDFEHEPQVMKEEVQWAISHLAKGKTPGADDVPIELLQGNDGLVDLLTTLCQQIWKTTSWPKDWTRSLFVPIPKKGDLKECSNYRMIALISHASKILLKIIMKRLESIVEREMATEQAGFRKNRGTRDHIANLKWMMEATGEYQKGIYLCFLDYSKAFDCVNHTKLWNTLRTMGVPEHLLTLIKNLYETQEAAVRTDAGNSEWFNINKGVRQGCILSPYLFNLYTEHILRNAGLDESKEGVRMGGRKVNNLRYADDTTLLAESLKDLKNLILKVMRESEKAGLFLNIKKTKIMATGDIEESELNTLPCDTVDCFVFLGVRIDKNGGSEKEIQRRLTLGKSAMQKLQKILKDRDISTRTKIRLVETLVFPVVMYGCESWTLHKKERKSIDSFELWCWRRLLRVPWTARRTNRSILDEIRPDCSLESRIIKQKLSYFGHIMRADTSMEKMLMLGKTEGRRRRGRPRMRWMEGILDASGLQLQELQNKARDRTDWRNFIHRVTRSRKRLDGT